MSHIFSIAIGDWSNDGHGHCEYLHYNCNKPIDDIREAYFKAKELHEELCPEDFCADYQEYTIEAEDMDKILTAFPGLNIPFEEIGDEEDGQFYISPEFMAAFTIEFIKAGDPDLVIEPISKEEYPSLHFYGNDKKKRHIGFIGYGVTGQ